MLLLFFFDIFDDLWMLTENLMEALEDGEIGAEHHEDVLVLSVVGRDGAVILFLGDQRLGQVAASYLLDLIFCQLHAASVLIVHSFPIFFVVSTVAGPR